LRAKYMDTTKHGKRYSLFSPITGPNGKTIEDIETGWQIDKGMTLFDL
jgi:hypothetical protein